VELVLPQSAEILELSVVQDLEFTELLKVQDLVPEVVLVSMELVVVVQLVLVALAPMEPSGTQKPGAALVLYRKDLVVTELKMSVELKLMESAKVQELV
jgi:hypothetical protein